MNAFIGMMATIMTFEIFEFTNESYDQVFELWKQCDGIGLSSADSRECIQTYIERNPGMSFIATFGNQVVGAVLSGHDGRRGYIHHLAVYSAYRRNGIARQLVEYCLGALSGAGIQKCHIFVKNDNKNGIEFWESIGWDYRTDIGVISKTVE